jgi:hypothetical protein
MVLSAVGVDAVVSLDGDHVVITPGVKGGVAKAARLSAIAYRRPAMLLMELDGPKRAVLARALDGERRLLGVLLRSIQADNRALRDDPAIDPTAPKTEALLAALRSNRRSVVAAMSNHRGAIFDALRRNTAVMGILIRSYIPVDQIDSLEVSGDTFHIAGAGERHAIRFTPDHAAEFTSLANGIRRSR